MLKGRLKYGYFVEDNIVCVECFDITRVQIVHVANNSTLGSVVSVSSSHCCSNCCGFFFFLFKEAKGDYSR